MTDRYGCREGNTSEAILDVLRWRCDPHPQPEPDQGRIILCHGSDGQSGRMARKKASYRTAESQKTVKLVGHWRHPYGSTPKPSHAMAKERWRNSGTRKTNSVIEAINWSCSRVLTDHERVSELSLAMPEQDILRTLNFDIDVPCVAQWNHGVPLQQGQNGHWSVKDECWRCTVW